MQRRDHRFDGFKMATFGWINEFRKENQSWEECIEQVTYFFSANKITEDDKKRQVLLTCVGAETFHLMKTLVAPAKLNTKTVAELAGLVQAHLDPKPSIIVSRYNSTIATGKQANQ